MFEDDEIEWASTLTFCRASKGDKDYVALLDTATYHDDEGDEVEDGRMWLELTVQGKKRRKALEGRRVEVTMRLLPPLGEWFKEMGRWMLYRSDEDYVWVCHYDDSIKKGWRWEHHHRLGSVISQRWYEEPGPSQADAERHLAAFDQERERQLAERGW